MRTYEMFVSKGQVLTEEQIEYRVENATNRLDARFMRGVIPESEYLRELSILDTWAQRQYSKKPNTDLANHDLFECSYCHQIADIEDSIATDEGLVCPDCAETISTS